MATKKKSTRTAKTHPIKLDPTSDAALMALDSKMAGPPDMPIDVGVREYASLARLAKSIARDLAKIGIESDQIELLARYAKRLKTLQASWLRARTASFLSKAEHKLLEEAEALDAKFVAGGRWACVARIRRRSPSSIGSPPARGSKIRFRTSGMSSNFGACTLTS